MGFFFEAHTAFVPQVSAPSISATVTITAGNADGDADADAGRKEELSVVVTSSKPTGQTLVEEKDLGDDECVRVEFQVQELEVAAAATEEEEEEEKKSVEMAE